MSTKTKTEQKIDYNKPSMGVYEGLQPQLASYYKQILGPIADSPWFRAALSMGNRQATQLGQRGVRNVMGNFAASGMSGAGMPGFLAANLGRAGRATSGLQANAFWNAYLGAAQQQAQGAQGAQAYSPLQMGQTTTQTKSGLGTWLPQTLGAVASIGLAPFTGGASLMGLGGLGASSFPGGGGGQNIGGMGGWAGVPGTSAGSGGWLPRPPVAPNPWGG